MGKADRDKQVAIVTTVGFLLMTIFGNGPSTYRFAIIFLGPMLWAIYWFRDRLHLSTTHFILFALALLLHNLGAFGAYQKEFLGIEFDIYVHFYFGVAGSLIVARALAANYHLEGWHLWVGTVLIVLGVGGIHELIEFASTLMLGPEKGMLKINSPDKYDTHKDLLNNLVGSLVALALYAAGLGKLTREQKNIGAEPLHAPLR